MNKSILCLALGLVLGCGPQGRQGPDDTVGTTTSPLLTTAATSITDGLAGLHGNSDAESQTVAVSLGTDEIAAAYQIFYDPVEETRCPGLSQIGLSFLTNGSWQAFHVPIMQSSIAAMRMTPSIASNDSGGANYSVYVSNVAFSIGDWPGYRPLGPHDPTAPVNDCLSYGTYKTLPGDMICVTTIAVNKAGAGASAVAQSCFGEAGANYYDTALTFVQGAPFVVSWNQAAGHVSFFAVTSTGGTLLQSPFAGKSIDGAPIFAKGSNTDLIAPDSTGTFWWTTLQMTGDPSQWTWSTPVQMNNHSVNPYTWSSSNSMPWQIGGFNQYTAVVVPTFMLPGHVYLFYRSGTQLVGYSKSQTGANDLTQVFTSRGGYNAFMPAAEVAIIPSEFGAGIPGIHPSLTYFDDSGFQGTLVLNYTWPGQLVFPFPGSQTPCPIGSIAGDKYWGQRDDMVVVNNNRSDANNGKVLRLWRFFTDSSISDTTTACNTSADEAAHITYNPTTGAVTQPSNTPMHVSGYSIPPGSFDTGSIAGPGDWNTAFDWAIGVYKGTCWPGWGMFGLSDDLSASTFAHSILCRKLDPAVFTDVHSASVPILPGDHRFFSRTVNGNSDWAPNYWKLECGNGQYVAGAAEQTNNKFYGILCGFGVNLHSTGCNTRVFDNQTSQGATDHPDWDFGYHKGECAANEYMAGVSVNPTTWGPHSILCCPR